MQIWTLKNRKTLLIITVAVLGLFGARWIGTNSLMAQDGHEHTEKTSNHNDHADHDEDSGHEGHGEEAGEHANQNKHDERDEHEEHGEHKDVVMLSDADMKKFGIEVAIASAGNFRWTSACPAKLPSMKIASLTLRRVFPVLCAK